MQCTRIATKASPNASRAAPSNPRREPPERRWRARCRRATSSSSRPGSPVSAATVIGVVCDAAAFGSLPRRCASRRTHGGSRRRRRRPPGGARATLPPFETSVERPLVALESDDDDLPSMRWRICGDAMPAKTSATRCDRDERQAPPAPDRAPRTSVPAASSATKLDCENDGSEPRPRDPDRQRRRDRPERVAAPAQDHDHAGEDRDDEEPSVDRRVVEHRVDAVEPAARRVGVVDPHLRVPEDVARLVLDDADHREDERHQRRAARRARAPTRATRSAGRARPPAGRTGG